REQGRDGRGISVEILGLLDLHHERWAADALIGVNVASQLGRMLRDQRLVFNRARQRGTIVLFRKRFVHFTLDARTEIATLVGRQRAPVGWLDSRDRGLQSKDVVSASDQMAQDLLADPRLNESRTQWLMVVDHVENRTTDRGFDMDIFLERLRVNLARYGKGRV